MRLLNYKRSGTPFWNMFTLAPMKDSDGTVRFFIGVQVDVSASSAAASAADKLPAWTDVAPADVEAKGHGAAALIGSALQGLGLQANPWAKLGGTVMRRKPHKAADRAYQALLDVQVGAGLVGCARVFVWRKRGKGACCARACECRRE